MKPTRPQSASAATPGGSAGASSSTRAGSARRHESVAEHQQQPSSARVSPHPQASTVAKPDPSLLFQKSVGNAVDDKLPSRDANTANKSTGRTPAMYAYQTKELKTFDIGSVPDRQEILGRPLSARSGSGTPRTQLQPRPPSASKPYASSASGTTTLFDSASSYDFGTATAQLRAQQQHGGSGVDSTLLSGTSITPPPLPPAATATNRTPTLAAPLKTQSEPILTSSQPASATLKNCEEATPSPAVAEATTSRPSTAKRPQSATVRNVLEVQETFDSFAGNVHEATAYQLKRPPNKIAPDDRVDIGSMTTFEHVVAYYAQNMRRYTPVKFVHMKRAPQLLGQPFRPYDLRVVPAEECAAGEEHLIVSSSSVVHMLKDQPAQVLTVAQFTQESSLFAILSKIKFFKTYLKYKMFVQWRNNIRVKLFMGVRSKLSKKFFVAKKTFVSPLKQLHHQLASLQSPPLVKFPHIREGVSLDRFTSSMATQKLQVLDYYRTVIEGVEHRLTQLAQQIRVAADIPDFASQEAIEQYVLFQEDQAAKKKGTIYNPNAIPIAQRKEHLRRHLSELRAALDEYQMLSNFIRLIDYIAAESMFFKALSSIQELTDEILRRDDEKTLYFLISVTFGDQGVVFVPADHELLRVTSDVTEEIISSSVYLSRIVSGKTLRSYMDASTMPKLHSISTLLRDDHRVIEVRRRSKERIESDYLEGQEATKHFGKNKKWLEFVSKVWPTLLGSWNDRFSMETLVKEFLDSREHAIANEEFADVFRKVEEAFQSLKEMHAVRRGCLVITSTVVLDFLIAKLKDITTECREKLLVVAKSRLDRIAVTLNARIKALQERPNQLGKFAAFASFVNQQVHDLPLLFESCEQIEQLYVIAELNGCEPGQEAGRRELVLGRSQDHGQSIRSRFEEATNASKDFIHAHMSEMSKKLTTELEVEYDSITTFSTLADSQILGIYNPDVSDCIAFMTQLEENIAASEGKVKLLLEWVRLFELPSPESHVSLVDVKAQVKAKRELWHAIERFNEAKTMCYSAPISDADVTHYAKEVDELYTKTYNRLHPRHQSDASERLLELLREEKLLMPTLVSLGNKNLKREHWAKILANSNRSFDPTMSLESMKHMKLFDHFYREVINEQSAVASGEATLLTNLDEIKTKWGTTQFQTKPFRDMKDYYILDDVSEVVQQLEEHQLLIQSCLASRFVAGVRTQIEDWERRLHLLSVVIDEWIAVQNSWMYLSYIFLSEDMKRQLPSETAMFKHVDSSVRELINRAINFKNCIVVATDAPVFDTLKEAHGSLDSIHKRLEEYLETKRAVFPRFYFLSNDELLSILSDVRNPRAVRPHLRKCFDSINDLVFKGDSNVEITGVVSFDGETVPFPAPVTARGGVEMWLRSLEAAVVNALKANMIATLQIGAREDISRRQWLLMVQPGEIGSKHNVTASASPQGGGAAAGPTSLLAQCLQASDCIRWTADVEHALAELGRDAQSLQKYYQQYLHLLEDTVKAVRTSLTPIQRSLLQTILVLSVHNRDVVEGLIEQKVTSAASFAWKQQLRNYFSTERGVVVVEHVNAELDYCYEYLGCAKRLVITPLTDRAFMTCTQALHLNLGAAPQGPAGTGKTESVKDLGKALARHVVVFNCSDGINTAMMSQMFAGLAQAGSWACFDEFNRIQLEVLSVVAQQMLELTSAVAQRLSHINFEGHELELNKHFGVFVTMNPGYAGRTELPDNLQVLFRPVCMMIPDYRLIAEIMFFSEGFLNAKTLSTKMVQLYRLSSEQLSKQDHYDFGMRAVKSILVMAGALKRAEPDEDEDMLLIRAMRDSNLPKFLKDDAQLFNAIITDLYPNIKLVSVSQTDLRRVITTTLEHEGLTVPPRVVDKTIQLFETTVSRFGVMLVGSTLSGKTTSSSILEKALATMHAITPKGHSYFLPTTRHTVNPKALSRDELYGSVNATTREWMDGVLSSIVRSVCSATAAVDAPPMRTWICFDGPVDAMWIENLNTVLDDNKMLCLVNGERIKLPDSMTFLFEVQDLRAASPATVSRCGMVYYDSDVVGWEQQLEAHATRLAQKHSGFWNAELFHKLTAKLISPSMEFLQQEGSEWISSSPAHRIQNFMQLLDAMISQRDVNDDDPPPTVLPPTELDEDGQELPVDSVIIKHDDQVDRNLTLAPVDDAQARLFEMMFLFAYIWGIGGNQCDDSKSDGRRRFSTHAKELILDHDPTFPNPIRGVSDHSVFDVCMHKGSLRWVDWAYKVPSFLYRRRTPFGDLLVSTPQTVATSFVTTYLLSNKSHVMINGTTGTGKSVNVQQSVLIERLSADDSNSAYQTFAFVMSAQSTGKQLQDMLEARLRKHPSKKKEQLCIGPAPGKTVIMFLDDVNMPQSDEYGASPTLELLRQLLSQGGVYDKKKCMFKCVNDVVSVACCGPPGGNRTDMSARLTSRYFLLCQPQLTELSVNRIFGSILNGFLSIFSADVKGTSTALTKATLDIYHRVTSELLPTPERTHYVFNMRDIGRVIQGITQTSPKECITRNDIVQLWLHEATRVFCDRMISTTDRQTFEAMVLEIAAKRFSQVIPSEWSRQMYADFTSVAEVPVYRRIEQGKSLQDVLTQKLREYAVQNNKDLDLVMFDDAVKHLARLCRILRQARGNAMLIGVSGSGRQSLAQLAAFLCRCQRYQIQLTSVYDHFDFRKDLRNVLRIAGCDNEPVAFILSDTQMVKEIFLEDINSLLNTGEITNLWEADDTEAIINSTRERVRRSKKPETLASMMAAFTMSCRDNLHVVLTMSPMGPNLFRRIRAFPSLINCVTIDWYDAWPSTALQRVAVKMLTEAFTSPGMNTLRDSFEEDLARVDDIATLFVYVHTTVEEACDGFYREKRRKAYCTPTSYIGLLQSFSAMLKDQRDSSEEGIQRFRLGLERLEEANRRVDDMKSALIRLQPELAKSTVETQQFAADVEREQTAATEVALTVSKEEAQCAAMMREAQFIKDECQAELDKAMPIYNEALDALNALNPKDIQEAKAYTSPPKKVEVVMDAVLTVLEEATGWDNAKRVLGRQDFVNILKNFDVNTLSEKTLKKLKKYTELEDFKPEAIKTVSKACVSFCLWCRAVENYCEVLKVLEPKRQKLAIAEAALAKAKAALAEKQAQLAEVEARLEKLRQQYDESMAHLKHLEAEKARTELHLARAEKLLTGLSSEHERWTSSIALLEANSKFALASTALASAFVAYLGVFDSSHRQMLIAKWTAKCVALGLSVDKSKPFNVQDIIDPVTVRHWSMQGLPSADFSVQNATIVSKSARWCLCIDPHSQANTWIKNTYHNQGLVVLRMSDANLTRHMEVAVRGGLAVLIEDVETTLDASLDPILRRETFRSGGRLMLTVRDQPVEYNPSFFLIMTSRLANPHYMPEVHVKTTVLNFDVTQRGLEDQLLSEVVRCEKRELEEKADQLVTQVSEARMQLKHIEDQILSLLSNSGGNLLENDVLITTLNQSKVTVSELKQGLHVIEGTSAEIQSAREVYRPIAARGAVVFNVIQQVGRLEHVYQTALFAFIQQFRRIAATTPSCESEELRKKALIDAITYGTYEWITRSLFEQDRSVFRFLLACTIAREAGEIPQAEWNYMLRESGGILADPLADLPGQWMPDAMWENLQFLSTLSGLEHLSTSIAENENDSWSTLRSDAFVTEEALPKVLQEMSVWHRMLVMRTLNSTAVGSLAQRFVRDRLGPAFNVTPPFDLSVAFAQSSSTIPITFLLSSGTDPAITFQKFADKMGMTSRTVVLSLGQGQGSRAEAAIQRGMTAGQWVFLQNCHVYVSWLPQLARIVESLASSAVADVHMDFRLWLSSLPVNDIPVSILQTSIKLTREPPRGIRANLKDSLALTLEHESWKSLPCTDFTGPNQVLNWRKLLFSVTLVHAILQERRKFGPVGWNVPYSWNLVDVENSLRMLHSLCNQQNFSTNNVTSGVNFDAWDAVYHLLGDINYGGRVTDLWDNRTLQCIMRRVMCEDVFSAGGMLLLNDGTYRIPTSFDSASLMVYVDQLPAQDPPELFGLHSNAEQRVKSGESAHLLKSLVDIQPQQGGGGGTKSNSFPAVAELLARLPAHIDLEAPSNQDSDVLRRDNEGMLSPLGNVAFQECTRLNNLRASLYTQLCQAQLALNGFISMNHDIEALLRSLSFGQVPAAWEAIAYPSLKPLYSWVSDLTARMDFFRDWVESGAPSSYWLGGFVFPQGFITALLQTHSRQHGIPVDELRVHSFVTEEFDVMEAVLEPLSSGAYIHGLATEGARWNITTASLDEFIGKEMSSAMPIVALVPTTHVDLHTQLAAKPNGYFECPVYKVASRAGMLSTTGISSNFVLSLYLECGTVAPPAHWVERGCALIASSSE